LRTCRHPDVSHCQPGRWRCIEHGCLGAFHGSAPSPHDSLVWGRKARRKSPDQALRFARCVRTQGGADGSPHARSSRCRGRRAEAGALPRRPAAQARLRSVRTAGGSAWSCRGDTHNGFRLAVGALSGLDTIYAENRGSVRGWCPNPDFRGSRGERCDGSVGGWRR
jgi:hypothetical protein